MDFEKNIEDLENIIKKMERENLSLSETLKLLETGTRLSKECVSELDKAKGKLQELVENMGELVTKELSLDD